MNFVSKAMTSSGFVKGPLGGQVPIKVAFTLILVHYATGLCSEL